MNLLIVACCPPMKFVNSLIVAAVLTGGLLVLHPAQAFEGHISPPTLQQCATATVTVTNDSVLPLDLLLIPYGPSPLSGASNIRNTI